MAKLVAINWESLKSGAMLRMKDFPSIKLLKLSNSKACYFPYGDDSIIVDIKEYESEINGFYYYFQTKKDDWHPLTIRLWEEYD